MVKEIIEIFNLPFEDIQKITYERLESMYDDTGLCYFEGAAYFVAYTTYGARVEIAEGDSRFLKIKELLRIDTPLNENKMLYLRS
ncbi:hypothetical protein [Bacillus ndiopicus]|uniref:hypothetical protein n=1 Tax=Bacillus ndiopicus TaxID=1347368 RepID=UPI0005A8D309|nr:hypothetical protein [Bacillus ndiopicus]